MTNKKNNKKVLAATLAAALLVTGTFAWQSISQFATNELLQEVGLPGGRLHDYFNGSNKDVFVENYTEEGDGADVFARIRLQEYFEYGTGVGAGSVAGATVLRGDISVDEDPEVLPLRADEDTWDIYSYGSKAGTTEDIRTYRTLQFGGDTIYLPTYNLDNEDKTPEINGTFIGTDGDGATNTDSRYDDNIEFEDGETYDIDKEVSTSPTDHVAKSTEIATVMSMEKWMEEGCPVQDTWVYDVDGWAYYAAPIKPEKASGLLLDGITQVGNPKEEWYYAVNVTAQLATAGDWGKEEQGTATDEEFLTSSMYASDMTDEGVYVLNKAAGLMTVENMTMKIGGSNLSASNVRMEPGATFTFSATMDVINGSTDDTIAPTEKEVTWSMVDSEGTELSDTDFDTETAEFTTTEAMIQEDYFVVTATSTLDDSKSVSAKVYVVNNLKLTGPEYTSILAEQGTFVLDDIEWIIIKEENDEVFLFANEPIGEGYAYGEPNDEWAASAVRTYINSEEFIDTYIPTLKENLVETTVVTNIGNNTSGVTGETLDKLFFLSIEELGWDSNTNKYVIPQNDDALIPSRYIGNGTSYQTRSQLPTKSYNWLMVVTGNGTSEHSTKSILSYKPRPALWVAL